MAKWNQEREQIATQGIMANKMLLMATGDTTIGEASPSDSTWGIGLSMKDSADKDQTKWTGENLLGKILMSVRNSLQAK